jgi:hypothetical protein
MARAAIKLHRAMVWKSFTLQRHSGMAGYAGFLFGLQSVAGILSRKLVACCAMECLHPGDIRRGLGVTGNAFFGGWLHYMERRQMA